MYIVYTPGTQMTLVLLEKGLVLEGSTPKIEDKQVPGIYIYTHTIFSCLYIHIISYATFFPILSAKLHMVGSSPSPQKKNKGILGGKPSSLVIQTDYWILLMKTPQKKSKPNIKHPNKNALEKRFNFNFPPKKRGIFNLLEILSGSGQKIEKILGKTT